MGKPEHFFCCLRQDSIKVKSSPKRAVQTSPLITFYTHGMLNLIFFSSSWMLLMFILKLGILKEET